MATYKVLKPFGHSVDGAGITYTKVGAVVELDDAAVASAGDSVKLVEPEPEPEVAEPDLGEWLAAENAHNAKAAEETTVTTGRAAKPR